MRDKKGNSVSMNTSETILEEEDKTMEKQTIEALPVVDPIDSLTKIIKQVIETEVQRIAVTKQVNDTILQKVDDVILQKIDEPKPVRITNTEELKSFPPDIQKVEGSVRVTNPTVIEFPNFEKIMKEAISSIVFPSPQEIPEVVFPETQMIKGDVTAKIIGDVVAKITEIVKTDVPRVQMGKMDVVPMALWDGKRFIDPSSFGGSQQSVQGNGRLLNAIERLILAVGPGGGTEPFYINTNYSSAQTNTVLRVSPGAGKKLVITHIIYSRDTAGNMNLIQDPAGSPATKFGPHYFPATGGMVSEKVYIPLSANKALGITTVGGGNETITLYGITESA